INPAFTWRPDADTRVGLSFEYVKSDFSPDSGLPIVDGAVADVPPTTSYQSPFDVSEQDVYRLRLDAEHRLSDHVTLRDKLYYTALGWQSDGTLIVGAFPVPQLGTLVARTLPRLDDRQKWDGNQLELGADFSSGRARPPRVLARRVSDT